MPTRRQEPKVLERPLNPSLPEEPRTLFNDVLDEVRDGNQEGTIPKEVYYPLVDDARNRRNRLLPDAMRRKVDEFLEQALQTVGRVRGWNLTHVEFDRIRALAALSTTIDRETSSDQRLRYHVAAVLTEQIMEQVLLLADSVQRPFLELDQALFQEAITRKRLEDRAYRHEVSGLLHSREAIRDLFLALRTDLKADPDPEQMIAVIELDIVGLKQLNDRFGIAKVDQHIIKDIGARLRKEFRSNDILAQLGGDEYQLILPCKAAGVRDVIDKVHRILEDTPFTVDHQPVSIQLRSGTRVYTREEAAQLNTTDANVFIDTIRSGPLEAVEYVKLQSGAGSAIWTEDLKIPDTVLDQMKADHVVRAVGPVVAHLSRRSPAAAAAFSHELEQLLRKHLKK